MDKPRHPGHTQAEQLDRASTPEGQEEPALPYLRGAYSAVQLVPGANCSVFEYLLACSHLVSPMT